MTHLIELVYPEHIELVLRQRTAAQLGCSPYRVARIVASEEFMRIRRRSLVLGASDGARLDRLRRSAPFLSHEQFLQSTEPTPELINNMRNELAYALKQDVNVLPVTFQHLFLVDDFAGSGETMLRLTDAGYKGKLMKLATAIKALAEDGLLSDDIDVTIVLYVATEQARRHLATTIASSPLPNWTVRVVQELPAWVRVEEQDKSFAALCELYYDKVLTDEHKGRAVMGYANCALPVILAHNTPNNSVSLLWV